MVAVPEVTTVTDARPGDVLLLTSDGVTLSDSGINSHFRAALARSPDDPALALCELLDRAAERRSDDNITAVCVQLLPRATPPICMCSACGRDGTLRTSLMPVAGLTHALESDDFLRSLRSEMVRSGITREQKLQCLQQCLDLDEKEVNDRLAQLPTATRVAELEKQQETRKLAPLPDLNVSAGLRAVVDHHALSCQDLKGAETKEDCQLDLAILARYTLPEQFEIAVTCRLPVRNGCAPVSLPVLVVPVSIATVPTATASAANGTVSNSEPTLPPRSLLSEEKKLPEPNGAARNERLGALISLLDGGDDASRAAAVQAMTTTAAASETASAVGDAASCRSAADFRCADGRRSLCAVIGSTAFHCLRYGAGGWVLAGAGACCLLRRRAPGYEREARTRGLHSSLLALSRQT